MTTSNPVESTGLRTHGLICDFGRHKGTPYTRLPVSYLQWMVNVGHNRADIAAAELERRGTVTPDLDVSGHAIDRASLKCLSIWRKTRNTHEGLHAWLVRMAGEAPLVADWRPRQDAVAAGDRDVTGKYLNNGMKLAFDEDGIWPVLTTVMRA